MHDHAWATRHCHPRCQLTRVTPRHVRAGKYLTPNFFPPGNVYAEQLSFWATYAVRRYTLDPRQPSIESALRAAPPLRDLIIRPILSNSSYRLPLLLNPLSPLLPPILNPSL
jgi:hypothetical protein